MGTDKSLRNSRYKKIRELPFRGHKYKREKLFDEICDANLNYLLRLILGSRVQVGTTALSAA